MQTYEAGSFPGTETIHFPKSCLHCEDPPCVPVCPTGASYKRKEDGIVLVDYDKCIGCKYCAWACPYGARELDEERQVMTKCTLCVDRIYDEQLPKEDRKPACVKACPTGARLFGDVKDPDSEVSKAIRERGGYALMPEWETQPANQYLPRRTPTPPATTFDRGARHESRFLHPVLHHAGRHGAGPGGRAGAGQRCWRCRWRPALLSARCCVAEVLLLVGLGASFLHLGRKTRAWRAVLMWRTSWMSREVIVLPAFIGAGGAVVAGAAQPARRSHGRLLPVLAIVLARRCCGTAPR